MVLYLLNDPPLRILAGWFLFCYAHISFVFAYVAERGNDG